jgi:hypothetical protein
MPMLTDAMKAEALRLVREQGWLPSLALRHVLRVGARPTPPAKRPTNDDAQLNERTDEKGGK